MSDNKFSNLRVTVDSKQINETSKPIDLSIITFQEEDKEVYPYKCNCELDGDCECGCRNLLEEDILDVYHSLDIFSYSDGRESGYRMDTLHVLGTHDLSTDDVINYFLEYSPLRVEWIDDMSCNVVFNKESSLVRALISMSEKYRVSDTDDVEEILKNRRKSEDSESELSGNKFPNYADNPPPGRWRKAFSIPEKAKYLYLRYAHKSDIKVKGAEKESDYYRKHGNPNFGGQVGIISGSYRKRARKMRRGSDADVREVKQVGTAKSRLHRQMVVYDGLYSDSGHSGGASSDDDSPIDRKAPRLLNKELKRKQTLTTMRMVADLEDECRKIPVSNRVGRANVASDERPHFDARKNISSKSRFTTIPSHSSIRDRLGPAIVPPRDSITTSSRHGQDLRKTLTAKRSSHRRRHRSHSSEDSS